MGLKLGIYSSAGTLTCAGYQPSIDHGDSEAATFAEWGVDFLKYDNCNIPSNGTDMCSACTPDSSDSSQYVNGTCKDTTGQCPQGYDHSQSLTFERYARMRNALAARNRTILYNLCEWGTAKMWTWSAEVAQAWRLTGDISPDWPRIIQIMNENSFYNNYADFSAHNDPDMLEIGNGNLTEQESRTHFGMWALMKAPLIMGTNLTQLSQTNVNTLQSKHLIAFNQDPVVASPAQPCRGGVNPLWTFNATNPAEYWSGESTKGPIVAMMNTLDETRTMRANWAEVPSLEAHGRYKVTNVWTGEKSGCVSKGISQQVETHNTAILLVTGGCGGQLGHGWGWRHG